jgi:Ca2+-binding RTX toxin-like protein
MPLRPPIQLPQDTAAANAAVNPADFVPFIDNPFMTLEPGATFVSESPDGSTIDNFEVTRDTKVVDGVTCVVVKDTTTVDGQLIEKTFDYFAQDKDGNVWYFGEAAKQYENGHLVGTEGSWQAGVNGADPGIIMEAHPQVGDQYNQENAPGIAQDHAEVLSLTESLAVPYGSFDHLLKTAETSLVEPGALEHKFYAAGVGELSAIDAVTGEVSQLVQIKVDGTNHGDTLFGYAGPDQVSGNGGADSLDGHEGGDTISGGSGNDTLDGGNDTVGDHLDGGSGNDRLLVRTADQADGGSGDDTIRLFDNTGFGTIDGGDQRGRDLGVHQGDVLQFNDSLDLTQPAIGARITGIETLSMKDGQGIGSLSLNVNDVLDLGDGTFAPQVDGQHAPGKGAAVRVNGDSGDQVTLSGGFWTEIDASNAPHDYHVFSSQSPGGNVYALVHDDVTVNLA